ncbi:metal ABC transporter solute-binding protein, Zn/Mn family [Bacillus sp. NEB1478]|uniref:metal ABC transporter solute-binding protein, Zn/Mn family n=1 Tax=Bacillus sp. NEB1478 TaxID=3073816 RepID=UPI002873B106|nr:zinc ABC transporter substrate-binding protein [Bacillus sp. NEB1478]WNB90737.1 zinc ABC transporter substrate-binding protein [Bacillus sp. NEB1478]
MRKLGLISVALLAALLTACGNNTSTKTDGTLNIYTTIYPLQYFTERIAGKHADVTAIIPPGADAHTFEPSTKDMVKISDGDAFIYNKSKSDEFSSSVADTLKEEKVPVIDAANGIAFAHMEEHEESEKEHDHGAYDPHIWLDPVLAQQMSDNIYHQLVKLKPEAKKDFKKNHDQLIKDLQALDAQFKEKVKKAPKDTFIVSHAAYGYWAERYGLKQIAISGLSPAHEPTQHQIQNIIEYTNKENIKYILFEANVNNKVAATIKKETGTKSLTLQNIETLTKKDMKKKRDYLSIMYDNIDTLSKALQ